MTHMMIKHQRFAMRWKVKKDTVRSSIRVTAKCSRLRGLMPCLSLQAGMLMLRLLFTPWKRALPLPLRSAVLTAKKNAALLSIHMKKQKHRLCLWKTAVLVRMSFWRRLLQRTECSVRWSTATARICTISVKRLPTVQRTATTVCMNILHATVIIIRLMISVPSLRYWASTAATVWSPSPPVHRGHTVCPSI